MAATGAAADEALLRADACRKEGNTLLGAGDLAGACRCYDRGLAAIEVEGEDGSAEAAEEVAAARRSARAALHLNAALAHLKRGNLGSAVDHSSDALKDDPKSAKAYYRRGIARVRLAEQPGHEREVSLAKTDFEEALRLEPSNAEVREQLKALRASEKAFEREEAKTQKQNFKGLFSSKKPLYEEPSRSLAAERLAPILRDEGCGEEHRTVLEGRGLRFHYFKNEPVINGVDVQVRAGWCLGMFGNNGAGKSTLLRLLSKKLKPKAGEIELVGESTSSSSSSSCGAAKEEEEAAGLGRRVSSLWGGDAFGGVLAALTIAAGAVAAAVPVVQGGSLPRSWVELAKRSTAELVPFFLAVAAVLFLIAVLLLRNRAVQQRAASFSVQFVTSEDQDKESILSTRRIEQIIADGLPESFTKEERRAKVIALLEAAGFQMYNQDTGKPVGSPEEYIQDGLIYGHLSGGQKHLIYVLMCFARRPDVLLCDELLGGLDAYKQPRVLHMLRRLKKECGTAILYITTELHQLRLVSDSVGFMDGGRIVELGSAEEVLEYPKHPATKEYLDAFRSLPGCTVLGGKLAQSYGALEGDAALAAPWLPSLARSRA